MLPLTAAGGPEAASPVDGSARCRGCSPAAPGMALTRRLASHVARAAAPWPRAEQLRNRRGARSRGALWPSVPAHSFSNEARHSGDVLLMDGTRLPWETLGDPELRPLVWGHGLGPEEPWSMGRNTCE